jgi:hypothetical protein
MSTKQLSPESRGQYNAKAYSAASATSPLAPTPIQRRDPSEDDVQIEILFCGICHSDLHTVRNEWSDSGVPTIYPCHTIIKQQVDSSRSCPMNDIVPALTNSWYQKLTLSSSSCQKSALFILEPHRGQLPPLNL